MRKTIVKLFFLVNLVLIIGIWVRGGGEISLFSLAKLFGLLAVASILLQFLLMSRTPWLYSLWGMDELAKVHRRNGKYAIYLMSLHVILIIVTYSRFSGLGFVGQLLSFLKHNEDLLEAFISFILFLIVVITSVFVSRLKLKYELWYFVHLMVYAAILLSFGHQLKLGSDFYSNLHIYYWYSLYAFVFLNIVYFRFIHILFRFANYQFYVKEVKKETSMATTVVISGKNMDRFKRKSGQFMIVRFMDRVRFWQAHPFSLSWGDNNKDIRLTIKNLGDFTSDISKIKKGTRVIIDGPHGRFTKEVVSCPKILFIAGGIGITPIRSLVETLSLSHEVALIYSNKGSEFMLKDELVKLANKNKFPVSFINTQKSGHMVLDDIKKYITDPTQWDIFLCGPSAFMNATIKFLIDLKVPAKNIHFEKFSLHG